MRRHTWNILYTTLLAGILVIPLAIVLVRHPEARSIFANAGQGLNGAFIPQQYLQALVGLGESGLTELTIRKR